MVADIQTNPSNQPEYHMDWACIDLTLSVAAAVDDAAAAAALNIKCKVMHMLLDFDFFFLCCSGWMVGYSVLWKIHCFGLFGGRVYFFLFCISESALG